MNVQRTEKRREDIADQRSHRDGALPFTAPAISLPKGGGAIRGIGEKFAANPVTGTGSITVPIAVTPGRSGFSPQLTLSYDSGAGNGPFGIGWSLSLPAITRKTDKGLPKYDDIGESDVFILSGSEDLVPVLIPDGDDWQPELFERIVDAVRYRIQRYRPRIEGLFARIERWVNVETGLTHWRSISKDNVTTFYGKTAESCIADPDDPRRIFTWLICESRDDKGNIVVYEYAPEDSNNIDLAQAHERNRTTQTRSTNRYPKRIKYGNQTSHLIQPDLSLMDWCFEVVFDYDEGHYETLPPGAGTQQFVQANIMGTRDWPVRRDPFSAFRAGFEVRTYRLCRRILMFHHFPEELGVNDYLVRSTDFNYRETPIASFITSATQSGYIHQNNGTYLKKSFPPIEFEYSEAVIQNEVHEIDAESLENLPYGVDGLRYQWVDLDGEGVSGILTEEADSWFYKPNIGEARFGPKQLLSSKPSLAGLRGGQQLMDLAGDGQLDLVQFAGSLPGFYERTQDGGWSDFTPFNLIPKIDWDSPYHQFTDLTGDGHPDILISEDAVISWHPSLAEEGFGPSERVHQSLDEEKGPRLIFADPIQSIFLADLSGDGLTDLVRIRNGEVCYWPNLGYGRFGARVTMDDSPRFDAPDLFDQRRILLADIDGSGVTDIIYLANDGIRLYFNQSGNSWSEARTLDQFPRTDSLSSVTVVDLLGNGTACLVWSSSLPRDARRPMRYVDLMGGQKPHLMVAMKNNMGAETHVEYAPSTKFYLADKEAGIPWVTRLPFPVHVVERVETIDRISRNRFVTRFGYHHGYFDGVEREFRGFGMVEQRDTEEFAAFSDHDDFADATNIGEASHVPPFLTKTWFHTGAYMDDGRITRQFEREYYREPGLSDVEFEAQLLTDTLLPSSLSAQEEREACRALKGSILRQETYALDGTPQSTHPYSVSERNYTIELLQPQAGNSCAVYFAHPRETIDYHYERHPEDPRIAHELALEVDAFGNILRSAAIGYGRHNADATLAQEDQAKQTKTLITCTENRFTNAVELDDDYRAPLPSESRVFELTGLAPESRFGFSTIDTAMLNAAPIAYESTPTGGLQNRLLEHFRTLYRSNNLSEAMPLGGLQSLALPFESYKLAFTPGLAQQVYDGRVTDAMLANEGHYIHSEGDDNWWIPSGRLFFSPNSGDTPEAELAFARQHFFLPHRFRDPFHTDQLSTESFVRYDRYDLLVEETRDALGNRVTVGERNLDPEEPLVDQGQDYRVLEPALVMDPNRNRAAVAFDALGLVVGTAVMGKPEDQPRRGDSLEGFERNLTDATVLAHLQDPFVDPHSILQHATTRLIYDLFAYQRTMNDAQHQGPVVYILARKTHDADLEVGDRTQFQHSFSYSDGFGREIQKKFQAEPGPIPRRDENGNLIIVDGRPEMTEEEVSPRWVGSGWTVFNNKGKPVRQFEPFFTDLHRFEADVRIGVSPILFYDPAERVVATLYPNHTWEKVIFDTWRQETWDVNDTVLIADPTMDSGVSGFFERLAEEEFLPGWHARRASGALGAQEQAAANKASVHADTPTIAHFDTLGRPFLTAVHNRFVRNGDTIEETYLTRVELDIEGNQREVIDARGRIVMRYDYDMLGTQIHSASMEAGERWILNDVSGKPIRAWNSRGHAFRTEYDALRRPLRSFVQGSDPQNPAGEILFERSEYGEGQPNDLQNNLCTRVFRLFDTAGIVTSEEYDFKGNLLRGNRQLASDYRTTPDWSGSPALDSEVFTSSTTYDAVNRPVILTTPDSSRIHPIYNEANLLERVEVNLRGADATTTFVNDIDYNAKGQRELIEYGNGVRTTYEYDPPTFRLVRLQTLRGTERLQDLSYTYDPAGNITTIRDDAQQTIYFNNQVVEAHAEYTYDAIYQLIEATGREHIGQVSLPQSNWNDEFRVNLPHPHDGQAMRCYTERYEYDSVGNFLRLIHQAQNGNWTRAYEYNEPSLIEPALTNNRLSQTEVGIAIETYSHDAHGNMTRMPNLPLMRWDYRDRLEATSKQVVNNGGTPETTYYIYDATGQRVRKVTERQAAAGQTSTRRNERIYLGGFEVYREYEADGATTTLERVSLHVMDDQRRVALIDIRTQGNDGLPPQLIRYQLGNHLGSAALELDGSGSIISYEEYYPYGTTSYQAGRSAVEVSQKRYRYTGKERDEETGLNYHGARYYAPWLGRWTAADPIGLVDGANVYVYVQGNPTSRFDQSGNRTTRVTQNSLDIAIEQQIAVQIAFLQTGLAGGNTDELAEELKSTTEAFKDELDSLEREEALAAQRQHERDLRRLNKMESPDSFYEDYPAHMEPYLRDQSAYIQDDYLRFVAQSNQRMSRALGRVTGGINYYMSFVIETQGLLAEAAGLASRGFSVTRMGLRRGMSQQAADYAEGVGSSSAQRSMARSFNDSVDKEQRNCVRCVASLLDAIQERGMIKPASRYWPAGPESNKLITESQVLDFLSHPEVDIDVKFGRRIWRTAEESLSTPGDYVIFTTYKKVAGYKDPQPRHVLWSRVREDGTQYFYDPQAGRKVSRHEVGPYSAYRVIPQ